MTSRSCWKAHERKIAVLLGGKRIPCSGSGEIKGDVLHPTYHVECKVRAKFVVLPWMEKAAKEAEAAKKIPLVVVREKGTRENEIVCIRLRDFIPIARQYTPEVIGTSLNGYGGATDDSNC